MSDNITDPQQAINDALKSNDSVVPASSTDNVLETPTDAPTTNDVQVNTSLTPVQSEQNLDNKEQSSDKITEELPLAFVSSGESTTTKIQSDPVVESKPVASDAVGVAPEAKAKNKTLKIALGVAGIVTALAVGIFSYSTIANKPQIAILTEDTGDGFVIKQTQKEEENGKGTLEKDGVLLMKDINVGINLTEIKKAYNECKAGVNKSENEVLNACLDKVKEQIREVSNTYESTVGARCTSDLSICALGNGVCRNNTCQARTCANGHILSSTGCIPNPDLSCKGTDYGAPVCCTPNVKCETSNIVCEPPGRKECVTTDPATNKPVYCLIEANSVDCGGKPEEPNERRSPRPSPSPSLIPSPSPSTPATNPVISCTGLSKTPTAPVMGSKVVFTCSGKITPSTAGSLNYEFVYKINGGSFKNLSNKTPTTAELTVSACGEYTVHCRVCATINGKKQCDPIWKDVVIQ
ncbi:MAG: hypothetical protein E6Q84_01010 [Thiothrix sp.]|nr:MAG: hypothetical protein E6Q84_01010 [Thiothrix sp.]